MDPLSIIGLASSIVQFIDFGLRVADRLDELSSCHPGDIPRSLQVITTQIPLVVNALGRINSESHLKNLDVDTKCILRGIVSGCTAQIAELESMADRIALLPGESFRVKMKKLFTSLKYDEKVREIERNLHTYISVLILHHVVDSADAPLELTGESFFDVREKRVSPFTERPRLMQELEAHLYDAARSLVINPTILVLAGPKGCGKTQLALEYCHQAHEYGQFPTQFWLDAATVEHLCLGFEGMYATIRKSTDGTRTEKINFVRKFLSELWHPWLLVLDNYEPTALYNNIMDFLPDRGYGGIILITRGNPDSGLGKVMQVPKFLTPLAQRQLNSLLTQATERKDLEGMKDAVSQGADVNSLLWDEWPVLDRAALHGLEDGVRFLLEHGADLDRSLTIRRTIFWAASQGNESMFRLLLDAEDAKGIPVTDDAQAAFHKAAEEGSLEIAQMLLSRRNVKLNVKNQYGETPLQIAARHGHVEVVRFLIDKGALLEDHSQGDRALINAATAGHFEVVKTLCCIGKVDPNAQDERGKSALCCAVELKDKGSNQERGEEMPKFLLDKGADPNPLSNEDSPLHRAAMYGHVNTARLLLEHGADPVRDCKGWDPLSYAIRYQNPEIITLLLQAKISDQTIRNSWLESALRYGCRAGHREAVLQLIEAGVNIDAVGDGDVSNGATPLLLAILYDHNKIAQLLLRRGARKDIADAKGRLPLPTAAEKGHDLLVRDLIRAGDDMNMKTGANGDTPLILAAGKGHLKVVKVLLDSGADMEITNKFGDMVLDVAEEKGDKDMIELLNGYS